MASRRLNHRAMSAGDSERTRLRLQPVVKRRADREHASARTALCLEDDEWVAGVANQFGGAQSREPCADDDDRRALSSSCAGSECEPREQELPAVHGRPKAMMFEPAAIATYCLLSNTYVIGDAFHSALV